METARKIDSTILAISKDQAEASNQHLMDQDHTDHRQYQPTTRTTKDSLLGLRGVMQEMGTRSLGQDIKSKLPNAMNRIPGMDMTIGGPPQTSETAQTKGHLHRDQTAGLVRHHLQHLKIRRRVQWRSGRPKRKRRCTKLLVSQRSYRKTMLFPRSGLRRKMKRGTNLRVLEVVRSKDARQPQVGAMDLDQEARRAIINTRCRRHPRRTDSRNISNIQRGARNRFLPFTSNLCRSTRRAMRRNEVNMVAISQTGCKSNLAINLIANHPCTTLRLATMTRQTNLPMAECHHEHPRLKGNSKSAENHFLRTRESFHLFKPRHNMYSRKHLPQMLNRLAPIQPNNNQKALTPRNLTNTTRRSRGARDHRESVHRLIPHQNLKHHHCLKNHTAPNHQQHEPRICRLHRTLSLL